MWCCRASSFLLHSLTKAECSTHLRRHDQTVDTAALQRYSVPFAAHVPLLCQCTPDFEQLAACCVGCCTVLCILEPCIKSTLVHGWYALLVAWSCGPDEVLVGCLCVEFLCSPPSDQLLWSHDFQKRVPKARLGRVCWCAVTHAFCVGIHRLLPARLYSHVHRPPFA
jgi:hypothetical protein